MAAMTGDIYSQTGFILPQCGHLIAGSLKVGGTLSLVPQAQVIVL
jgi:hypothetical protein